MEITKFIYVGKIKGLKHDSRNACMVQRHEHALTKQNHVSYCIGLLLPKVIDALIYCSIGLLCHRSIVEHGY